MKNVMSKNKTILIGTLAIMGMAFSNLVAAQDKTNPAIEVKYLGFRDNNPVFEIFMNNSVTDNFIVAISNQEGYLLYSEKLKGKNISRRYRIDTEEVIAEGGLRFEVRSVKSNKTEIYIAGTSENTTREMAISKLQ